MFEAYEHRLTAHRPKAFALPGLALFVAVCAIVQVRSVWSISAFLLPREPLSLALALPPEAPPPPPKLGGGEARPAPAKPTIKAAIEVPVQPRKPAPDDAPQPNATALPDAPPGDGTLDGERDGEIGGMAGERCQSSLDPDEVPCGTGTSPDPDAKTGMRGDIPPSLLPPTAFRANRVAGNEQIQPDDVTKLEISRAGKTRLLMSVKVCIDSGGDVTSATPIGNGTGFAAYDAKIVRAVSSWRYDPFVINGSAAPACSVVQFVYVQRS